MFGLRRFAPMLHALVLVGAIVVTLVAVCQWMALPPQRQADAWNAAAAALAAILWLLWFFV